MAPKKTTAGTRRREMRGITSNEVDVQREQQITAALSVAGEAVQKVDYSVEKGMGGFNGYSADVQAKLDKWLKWGRKEDSLDLVRRAFNDLRAQAPLLAAARDMRARVMPDEPYTPSESEGAATYPDLLATTMAVHKLLGKTCLTDGGDFVTEITYAAVTNLENVMVDKGTTTVYNRVIRTSFTGPFIKQTAADLNGTSTMRRYIWTTDAMNVIVSDIPSSEMVHKALKFSRFAREARFDYDDIIKHGIANAYNGSSLMTRLVKGFLYLMLAMAVDDITVGQAELRAYSFIQSYTYENVATALYDRTASYAYNTEADFPGLNLFLAMLQRPFPSCRTPLGGTVFDGLTIPADGGATATGYGPGYVFVNEPQERIDLRDPFGDKTWDAGIIERMLVAYAHSAQCESDLEVAYITAIALLNHGLYSNVSLPRVQSITEAFRPAIATEHRIFGYRAIFTRAEILMCATVIRAAYIGARIHLVSNEAESVHVVRRYMALRSMLSKDDAIRRQLYARLTAGLCTDVFKTLAYIDVFRKTDNRTLNDIGQSDLLDSYWALNPRSISPKSIIANWASGLIYARTGSNSAADIKSQTTRISLGINAGTLGYGANPRIGVAGPNYDTLNDLVEGSVVVLPFSTRNITEPEWADYEVVMTVRKLGAEIAEPPDDIDGGSNSESDSLSTADVLDISLQVQSQVGSPISEDGVEDIYGDVGEPGPLRVSSESVDQSSLGDGGNDNDSHAPFSEYMGQTDMQHATHVPPQVVVPKPTTAKKLPAGSFFGHTKKSSSKQFGTELADKLPPKASPLPPSPTVKIITEEEKKKLQLAAKSKGVVRQMVSSDNGGAQVPMRSLVAQYSKKKSTSIWQSAEDYLRAHKGGRHIRISEPAIPTLSAADIEELQELHVMIRWQDKRYQGAIGPIKSLYRDVVFRFEGGKDSAYRYIKFGSQLDESGRRSLRPELTPLGSAVLDTGSIDEYLRFMDGYAPPESMTSVSTLYSRLNLIGFRELVKPTKVDPSLSPSKLTALCSTLASRKIIS